MISAFPTFKQLKRSGRRVVKSAVVALSSKSLGSRTLLSDSTGRYTATYDNLNRQHVVSSPNSKVQTLTYDNVSQRRTHSVTGSGVTTYTHDPARQLTELKNGHNETITMVYDAAGRKTETKLSNLTKTSLTYDAANQMTGVVNQNSSNTVLSYFNYGFDHIGNRTSIWDNGADVSNWVYDNYGQQTVDFYRPATTALNWYGLSAGQWDQLSLDGWDDLLVWSLPAGGTGTLVFSPPDGAAVSSCSTTPLSVRENSRRNQSTCSGSMLDEPAIWGSSIAYPQPLELRVPNAVIAMKL